MKTKALLFVIAVVFLTSCSESNDPKPVVYPKYTGPITHPGEFILPDSLIRTTQKH